MAECYILQAFDRFVGWIMNTIWPQQPKPPQPEPTPKPESEPPLKSEPVPEPTPKPEPEPTGPVGDYIDRNWSDSQVVELAMKRMLEEMFIVPLTKVKCMKLANTCIYLLESYAMLLKRKEQLYSIKNKIKEYYPNIADTIDINGQFSNCSFYEGKRLTNL